MPDVVDLLSSPLPAPKVGKKADFSTSQAANLSKALNNESSHRKNEDWLTISSDSVDADCILTSSKPGLKPLSNTSVEAKSSSNSISNNCRSAITTKATNEICFCSDDFDSSVNLDDDPFASVPPPAKKRRLSPPLNSSMITRSTGFQKLASSLEKSTTVEPDAVPSKQATTSALTYEAGSFGQSAVPKTNSSSSKDTAPKMTNYKRSVSDLGVASKTAASRTTPSGLRRSKTISTILESDPILFTSPQETPRNARKRKEKEFKECPNQRLLDSSGDEIFDLSSRRCESSDLDLPDVAAISVQGGVNTSTRGIFKGKGAAIMALEKYEAEKSKERKHNQKEQNAKNKSATKEAEKEQKRLAKEKKAMERERVAELAKVNVLRTDKKKSTREMIVDMPSCLDTRLAEQIRTFLKPVEAEHSEYECTQPVIKWRRKIDSNFNEEAGHWEKVKSYVGSEKHIMFIMTAEEFVDLATGEEGKDLDSHVLRLKAKFSANDIIYLIQGLQPWMRKNKNRQNRKYLQDVRYQMSGEANAPAASQKRRKRPEQDHVEEDLLEDVLLKLQVMHGVLIHHTSVAIETAEWVVIFTQHISTVRYRAEQRSLETAFCMESGQVKVGNGPAETFARMLQEMVRITASVTYGIAAEYPTIQKLVKGFKDNGPYALQDCKKTANRDGGFTDKRVGSSVSKRVYNVFMSRDAGSHDV